MKYAIKITFQKRTYINRYMEKHIINWKKLNLIKMNPTWRVLQKLTRVQYDVNRDFPSTWASGNLKTRTSRIKKSGGWDISFRNFFENRRNFAMKYKKFIFCSLWDLNILPSLSQYTKSISKWILIFPYKVSKLKNVWTDTWNSN